MWECMIYEYHELISNTFLEVCKLAELPSEALIVYSCRFAACTGAVCENNDSNSLIMETMSRMPIGCHHYSDLTEIPWDVQKCDSATKVRIFALNSP